MREFELVERLAKRLAARRPDTVVGIGDDAAVLAPPPGEQVVVTTDTLIAGRHFPEDATAEDVGYKALAVNLSDVAAMGATPAWATLALSTPELDANWCDAFIDGALQAIGRQPVDILGGDTTRGPLAITVTVLGLVSAGKAVTRSGALPGDRICVTGTLGDAALGLRHWMAASRAHDQHLDYLFERLHRPRWRAGAALIGRVHAAIDISDGLMADLGHILAASRCGACIDVDVLPASPAFDAVCPRAERRRLQLAGGDDYELCLVLPERQIAPMRRLLDCRLTVIGTIQAAPGLRLVDASGRAVTSEGYAGWDHFG